MYIMNILSSVLKTTVLMHLIKNFKNEIYYASIKKTIYFNLSHMLAMDDI